MRTAAALRGTWASFNRASKRSSIECFSSLAISKRRLRRAENFFTSFALRLLFSTALFFAIKASSFPRLSLASSLPEREIESGEQSLRLRVGPGRRANDDVETQHRFRLVVV